MKKLFLFSVLVLALAANPLLAASGLHAAAEHCAQEHKHADTEKSGKVGHLHLCCHSHGLARLPQAAPPFQRVALTAERPAFIDEPIRTTTLRPLLKPPSA